MRYTGIQYKYKVKDRKTGEEVTADSKIYVSLKHPNLKPTTDLSIIAKQDVSNQMGFKYQFVKSKDEPGYSIVVHNIEVLK